MRRIVVLLFAVVMVSSVVAGIVPRSQQANGQLPPVLGNKIPLGYRNWPLISVAREQGDLNDIRAKFDFVFTNYAP